MIQILRTIPKFAALRPHYSDTGERAVPFVATYSAFHRATIVRGGRYGTDGDLVPAGLDHSCRPMSVPTVNSRYNIHSTPEIIRL